MGKKNLFILSMGFLIYLFACRSVLAIDINTATAEELARELDHVGPVKAQRIVEYRQKIGGFVSPEQLLEVYGIGPKTLERNREKIVIANNTAQLALLNEAYHAQIDLSPPLAKSPRLVTPSLFWDSVIIIPLFCFCLFIFIKAWLISLKKDKVTANTLEN